MTWIPDVVDGTAIAASWGNAIRNTGVSTHASIAAADSAISSPVEGQIRYLNDLNIYQMYNGSAWDILSRGLLGGTRWTGGGNFVTGLTTTELATMTAASVTIPPKTTVEISIGVRMIGSVTADIYILRLRETNVSGTQRGESTWFCPKDSSGFNEYWKAFYENTNTSSQSIVYCVTAQRVAGTGSLTMVAGGGNHNTHILTSVISPSGVMTLSATP